MPLVLLARPLFKVLSICIYFRVKDNMNTFRISHSLYSTRSLIGCCRTFTASEHQEGRGVWFAVSMKAKFKSCLPLIPATSLLFHLDRLTSLLSIGSTIIELE